MVKKYNDVVSTDEENIKDFGKKVCDVFDEDLDKYPLVRLIGEGAYGKACVALQTSSDQNLVVLKFIKNKIVRREDLHALAKEWGNIRHRHIVQLLAHFHSSRGFCFVIEYAPKGNLSDLRKEEILSTEHIQKIIVQLLQALNYLHTEGMFHGSLKPQNILIFDGGTVIKISDFGLAQIIWKTFKDLQHTKGITSYMSPETRLSNIIYRPSDLWSAGIVSFQLLGGEMPTDSHGVSATVDLWHYRDFHGKKPLIQRLPESRQDLGKLVYSLLQKNPMKRDLEWPESLRSQIVSDASNDVEPMDQLLRTNAAGVGAHDTARPEGAQLQDLNENKSHKDFEYDIVMAILLSLESLLLSDADAFADTRMLNESFLALIKDFTIHINNISKPEYYKILVKYLYVVTKVLKKNWYTHRNYWMNIVDIFRKAAAGCAGEAEFATTEHDYNTCYISLLSWVAQKAPEEMLTYAKRIEVINTLLSWLITNSISFEPLGILPSTCEASNAICSLLTVQSPDQLNVVREECKQIVHAVTTAFLDEKHVRYAFYVRLRYGSPDTKTSIIQIVLRCCMYEKLVGDFLCHLPGSSPVREVVSGDGGGDGSIVSLIFDLLSSYATDPETVQIGSVDFISNLCLVLATIAQSLDSLGRTSVGFMLTSTREVQDDRLFILIDRLPEISISLMPSVRLAVASIFFLERSRTSSFSKIAMPSIPRSETLRKDLGAVLAADGNERQFSTQQASRLKWGKEEAVRQFYYKDVPKILIDLMGGNIHSSDNQIGLSPMRVSWILSLLNHCREIYFATIFELSFTKKYIKFMSGLISDVHLEHIKCWDGPGGGEYGVRYIVDAVTGLLESPLAALKDACGGNGIQKGRILGHLMPPYIESLVEEGIPGQVVKCLEDVELEHATTPLAFLARMTHHRSATAQILDKGLFDPTKMKRLFDTSSPTEVKRNMLKIVSDIATMDKYLYVVTEVLKKNSYTHRNYWMDIVDFFRKAAVGCAGEAGFVTIEHEYNTCYISLLSCVAQKAPEEMLTYPKRIEVINTLLSWLTTTSKSFQVGILPLTCEASNAICSFLTAQSPDQLNMVGEECKQIVHVVTKAFLDEKDVRYAFYVRLRYGSPDTKTSVIQIILRCCMYEKSVGDFLCHLPGSSPSREVVSGDGGGDGTIVSLIFGLLCSYATDPETVQIGYPVDFISNLCLVLATIAQSLDSLGKTSVRFMLTSSREVQNDRLSILYRLPEVSISLMPSVRLAVASIFFLEKSRTSSFSKIAMPSIPKSETLRKDLRAVLATDGNERQFSTQQAFMDGTVGLLVARLKWGNEVAVRQNYYKDVPKILIDLMGGNNQIELLPVRVSWILSLLNHCREIYFITIFELSFTKEYIKFMSGLISDVHLEHIKRWGGPGGGEYGVRYIVNVVTGLLESPLAALKDASGGYGIKKGRIKGDLMPTYIESLVEEGIPGQVVKCLKDVELEHATTPVAFLTRMTHHRSATVQILDKGIFDPIEMRRLLDTSSPTKVKQNILKIVSDIATMDKVYYEHIEGADILPFLRKFLTDEDPKLRLHVCETIRHMCQHSDYFYGLLEEHKIAPLLVDCYSDKDPVISIFAGTAIAVATIHNELLHKDLGKCIPQLARFLYSDKEDHKTKKSACYMLRALVINSGKLCKDIYVEGAMEALIMLVGNCLLHPCNQPEDEEKSLLDVSLETLENLCKYSYCRDRFHSSAHYRVIEQACHEAVTESKVAASVLHIFE